MRRVALEQGTSAGQNYRAIAVVFKDMRAEEGIEMK